MLKYRKHLFYAWLGLCAVVGYWSYGLASAVVWPMFSATAILAGYYLCRLIHAGYRRARPESETEQ